MPFTQRARAYVWKGIVDKNAQVGSTPFFSLRQRILDRVSVIVDR